MKRAQLLKIKAQVSSIWAKIFMLMIVGVLSVLTCLPLLGDGRKSWYISYIIIIRITILIKLIIDEEGCMIFHFFNCSSPFCFVFN